MGSDPVARDRRGQALGQRGKYPRQLMDPMLKVLPYTVGLPRGQWARSTALAKAMGVSWSYLVSRALAVYMGESEGGEAVSDVP